jgi:hypothetical protein
MAQWNLDGRGHFDILPGTRLMTGGRIVSRAFLGDQLQGLRKLVTGSSLNVVQEAIAWQLKYPQFGNRFFVQINSQAWGIRYLQEAIYCYRFLVSDLVAQGSFFFDHEFHDERVGD